jgi:Phasin protein
MKHQRPPQSPSEQPEANPFHTALDAPLVKALGQGASVFGRSVNTFQQEGMRFMTRRLEQNARAIQEFGACKSLPDLLSAQQRWFAETARAYSEELAKCGELMTEVLHENGNDAGNGHDERTSDTPRRSDGREH